MQMNMFTVGCLSVEWVLERRLCWVGWGGVKFGSFGLWVCFGSVGGRVRLLWFLGLVGSVGGSGSVLLVFGLVLV